MKSMPKRFAAIGLLLIALGLAGACTPKIAPVDAADDLAAYAEILPAQAPELDPAAVSAEALAAFDFSRSPFPGGQGWYYFNGHLLDQESRRWTIMFAILPDWQVFGIVELPDRQITLPIYRRQPTVTLLDDRSLSARDLATLRQPEAGRLRYEFKFEDARLQLNLTLSALKAPIRVNGHGEITMGHTGTSSYYLIPSMRIAGDAFFENQTYELSGLGWMDHQWGKWDLPQIRRWHWHAIHLSNGGELMVFEILNRDPAKNEMLCDYVKPDGGLLAREPCQTKILQTWASPRTGKTWAAAWRIEMPMEKAELTLIPDSLDREINPVIYEGGCHVSGTFRGEPVVGRSFYEEYQK